MNFDYDLAIIGRHPAALEAALVARSLRGRVALIFPTATPQLPWPDQPLLAWWGLTQVVHRGIQAQSLSPMGWQTPQPTSQGSWLTSDWAGMRQWVREAIANSQPERSPETLAITGVDVMWGEGQFFPKPHLGLSVTQPHGEIRTLSARAYLLAPDSTPEIPSITGLEQVPYLTPDRFWQEDVALPSRLAIIGHGAIAVEIAQVCHALGVAVTLVADTPTILPHHDPELAYLLQCHLEALGISVYGGERITQVRQLNGSIWLQIGDRAVETDAVMVAGARQPRLAGLNLERVGISRNALGKVPVNAHLRTANPRIYACGEAAWRPGSRSADLVPLPFVVHQAHVAVKNGLFFPWYRLDDRATADRVNTSPPLIRMGLTEPEARQRFGKNMVILRQKGTRLPHAQIRGDLLNVCKVIVQGSTGKILGAHWLGIGAEEGMGAIALAMQKNLPISDLAHLSTPAPGAIDTLRQIVQQWQQYRLKTHPRFTNLLESWCNFRRG